MLFPLLKKLKAFELNIVFESEDKFSETIVLKSYSYYPFLDLVYYFLHFQLFVDLSLARLFKFFSISLLSNLILI